MLDEMMRQRLRGLAVQDAAPGLGDAAQERIFEAVRRAGPAQLRRGRQMRVALYVAGPVLAAAAAIAVFMGSPQGGRPAVEPVAAVAPAERPSGAACERWEPQVSDGAAFVSEAGTDRLSLGRLGVVAAPPSAEVRLTEVGVCRTVIGLESGRVVVHAVDLGGGTLRVDAGNTRVEVHGTLFSVEREGERVSVEVFEGVVSVEQAGRRDQVRAGERFAVTGIGTARGGISSQREAEARALVQAPRVIGLETLEPADVVPEAPKAPSAPAARTGRTRSSVSDAPGDVLARAERLRRAGDYEAARKLYRQVGSASGATAEAAWLALARMELGLGRTEAARRAASVRRDRFGGGSLGPEAQWLEVRIHRQAGREQEARSAASELVRKWPSSPQAAAAERWLAGR